MIPGGRIIRVAQVIVQPTSGWHSPEGQPFFPRHTAFQTTGLVHLKIAGLLYLKTTGLVSLKLTARYLGATGHLPLGQRPVLRA